MASLPVVVNLALQALRVSTFIVTKIVTTVLKYCQFMMRMSKNCQYCFNTCLKI